MPIREPDAKGAVERDFIRLDCIDGGEVLGYRGEGREEHSGENAPIASDDPRRGLADNLPAQIIADELAKA
ncbi:MAG TPA: hypothetical protein VMS56_05410 [Thermoanaerobaculia bacterium]|nr:hypothetical protein [Thermoanaerobaculia bacterium]